jgi:hypothetical protein
MMGPSQVKRSIRRHAQRTRKLEVYERIVAWHECRAHRSRDRSNAEHAADAAPRMPRCWDQLESWTRFWSFGTVVRHCSLMMVRDLRSNARAGRVWWLSMRGRWHCCFWRSRFGVWGCRRRGGRRGTGGRSCFGCRGLRCGGAACWMRVGFLGARHAIAESETWSQVRRSLVYGI